MKDAPDMIVIGLTGSIGMGKSATAKMFAAHGIPVHDADAAVHALYEKGGATVAQVEAAFPGVSVNGRIDRARLSERVVGQADEIARLETIVHPLVAAARERFFGEARVARARMAILEVPLLMETGGDKTCNVVVVTTAPADVQRERVLAREGMTAEKFEAIRTRQMSDADKRARAHFIVETQHGFAAAERQVGDIVRALAPLRGAGG